MNTIKYVVKLIKAEREQLLKVISKTKVSAKKSLKARILLKADISEEGEGWDDEKISKALEVSTKTIYRLRKKFVEEGFDACLKRKGYTNTRRKTFEGEEEAQLIAICCTKPPKGFSKWTLNLLKDKVIELNIVENTSTETIRRTLKKMNLNPG
jgi:transposase